jgi:hypothetical protein
VYLFFCFDARVTVVPVFFLLIGSWIDPSNAGHTTSWLCGWSALLASSFTLSSKFFFHFRRQAEVSLYVQKEPTLANYFDFVASLSV